MEVILNSSAISGGNYSCSETDSYNGDLSLISGDESVEFLRDESFNNDLLDTSNGASKDNKSFVVLAEDLEESRADIKEESYAVFTSPPRILKTPVNTPMNTPSNSASKSSSKKKLIKSPFTSMTSPNGKKLLSSFNRSWFNSLSATTSSTKATPPPPAGGGARRKKNTRLSVSPSYMRKADENAAAAAKNKKCLTSVFESTFDEQQNTKDNNNEENWLNVGPSIPRSNSTSNHDRSLGSNSGSVNLLNISSAQNNNNHTMIDSDMSTLNLTQLCHGTSLLDQRRSSIEANNTTGDLPNSYYTIDSKRLASRHKKSMRDKKLLYGIKQFNLEPKRGIEYLVASEFLEGDNAKNIASFLYREGRLSKKQIGAYLGDHHEFNRQVLGEFVKVHEFTHLILVQALRQFLWSFRLPGEAMQIDRVMEAFAAHYCDQNPNLFDEVDTCYILSFSIIMLNTALHNPNIRHKITLEQFIKQNRGINSGKDLPPDILELIYRNIKEEPFKIPKETYDDLMYTFFSPEKEGWLLKQGGSWKSWKRRWFVLSDKCLYYFRHTAENVPKGIIPLENVKVRSIDDKDGKLYCFELYSESNSVVKGCKTDSKGTVVQGNHRVYRMSASSAEDREEWVQFIRDSIKEHPFYDIIASKKLALRRKSLKGVAAGGGLAGVANAALAQQQKPQMVTMATSTTTLNNQYFSQQQQHQVPLVENPLSSSSSSFEALEPVHPDLDELTHDDDDDDSEVEEENEEEVEEKTEESEEL